MLHDLHPIKFRIQIQKCHRQINMTSDIQRYTNIFEDECKHETGPLSIDLRKNPL